MERKKSTIKVYDSFKSAVIYECPNCGEVYTVPNAGKPDDSDSLLCDECRDISDSSEWNIEEVSILSHRINP